MNRSKFFKQPSNWGKLIKAQENKEALDIDKQALFHASAIKKVKSVFKSQCTFLSHSTANGEVGFIAIFNINGARRRFSISTEGKSAAELVAEDYKKLKEVLHERTRSKVNI